MIRLGKIAQRATLAALVAGALRGPVRADAVDDAYEFLNQRHIPFTEEMFLELVDRGDHENLAVFLKAGMSPNLERRGTPILIDAARKDRLKVVNVLLEGGALPNTREANGWTALHFAALFDFLEVAKALVEKGANVRAETPLGMTALHYAVQERDVELVALLLEHGAKPEAQSRSGITPLAHAIVTDQPAILKLFEKRGLGSRIKQLRRQFADELARASQDQKRREREHRQKFKKALDAAGGSRSPAARGAR